MRGGKQKASLKQLAAPAAPSTADGAGDPPPQVPPAAVQPPMSHTQTRTQLPLKRRQLLVKLADSSAGAPEVRPAQKQPPAKRPCLVAKPAQARSQMPEAISPDEKFAAPAQLASSNGAIILAP